MRERLREQNCQGWPQVQKLAKYLESILGEGMNTLWIARGLWAYGVRVPIENTQIHDNPELLEV